MWVHRLSVRFMCHLVHLSSKPETERCRIARKYSLNDEGTSDLLGESEHSRSNERHDHSQVRIPRSKKRTPGEKTPRFCPTFRWPLTQSFRTAIRLLRSAPWR